MRRHSVEEIASKVREAEELMTRGQSQAQACKALGVSVMTFHRWRKLESSRVARSAAALIADRDEDGQELASKEAERIRMDELRVENDRLRRIVTDLLLEKMKIEEKLALETRDKLVRRGSLES